MGLVLWIDQNTFATALLEKVFKKKNLSFYSLANAEDFTYLVNDLKPELLVLDSETALHFKDALEKQYADCESLRGLPVVMIDERGDFPYITNRIGMIKRPFDPFQIPDFLKKISEK